ncbi:flagellar biosynthetic protein FliR [Vulgatibacter incomptus]|uniref:Flagellar biosynthesis protein FliR n=1 Tax=Vulgatibacter incomptus TaxID=1391653 RepID=A0A0K1PHX8_9BACT|nr:flagellar biosynthetic protein FliR [Vulgatibacter incomptus]AKU93011.1 Flagellar biosynthesis protein FliR [Vulgatibacter incomptus]
MDEQAFPFLFGFGLVLFRAAGVVAVAPVLSARMIPTRIRIGVAFVAALAAHAGAGFPSPELPASLFALAGSALSETAIGLAAGLGARIVLDAALAAGQLAGLGMGLGFSAIVDPVGGVQSSTLGQLFSMAALGFAVTLGVHREAIAWLARSVREMPPGLPLDAKALLGSMVAHSLGSFALSVRLAFPILAAVTVGHLALGLVGRIAPQMNLSTLGFSVAILAGGGAVYLVVPTAAEIAARMAVEAFTRS